MKAIHKLLIGLGLALILCTPTQVKADDETYNNHEGCTYANISDLKKRIMQVKLSYEYDKTTLMTITLSNLQADFYAVDEATAESEEEKTYFQYNAAAATPGIVSVSDYYDNQTVTFNFYASTTSVCAGEKIGTNSIRLPRYNPYYGHAVCEGINPKDFELCSKWYPTKMSEATFVYKVNQYKAELEKAKKPVVEEKEETTLIDILIGIYPYILIGIFTICVGLIAFLAWRAKKNKVV